MNIRFLLTVFLGILGAHKFYQGNKRAGLIYLFTGGLVMVGWVGDSLSLGFRGRDAFFLRATAESEVQIDPQVSRITKALALYPLLIVLISMASDPPTSRPAPSSSVSASGTGLCTVHSILHNHAFICVGGRDICGLDSRTILIVNGEIMPPQAVSTQMIKPGYVCSCVRDSVRTAHAKIDCTG